MAVMTQWVALLRGVNVGGGNKVPMAELRAMCADLGWDRPQTYIASGNLVFGAAGNAADLAERLRQAMAERMGVDVPAFLLAEAGLRAALAACPFRPDRGKDVHAFFLWADPQVDLALRDALTAPGETLVIQPRLAWLHAPAGIGRSKLAEKLHKVLAGTEMTARNLNTLLALAEMLDARGAS